MTLFIANIFIQIMMAPQSGFRLVEYPDEEIFLGLYEAFNKILDFHVNERYFEQEIAEYYKIITSSSDIKTWIAKNEDLGAKEHVSFILGYLDYYENDRVDPLKIYIHNSKELEIYIDRQDFRKTTNFLKVFNELHWVQEILHH